MRDTRKVLVYPTAVAVKADEWETRSLDNGDMIARKNGIAVVVRHDDCSDLDSPREWNNLGKMLLDGHKRYTFPVEITHEQLQEAEKNPEAVILDVYMYEHSGIALSCRQFSDAFDSGKLGWIVAFPEDIKKEYNVKVITDEIRNKAIRELESEVECYNKYINGEVYRYSIYNVTDESLTDQEVANECDGSTWRDGCCGFYSEEEALAFGKDAC